MSVSYVPLKPEVGALTSDIILRADGSHAPMEASQSSRNHIRSEKQLEHQASGECCEPGQRGYVRMRQHARRFSDDISSSATTLRSLNTEMVESVAEESHLPNFAYSPLSNSCASPAGGSASQLTPHSSSPTQLRLDNYSSPLAEPYKQSTETAAEEFRVWLELQRLPSPLINADVEGFAKDLCRGSSPFQWDFVPSFPTSPVSITESEKLLRTPIAHSRSVSAGSKQSPDHARATRHVATIEQWAELATLEDVETAANDPFMEHLSSLSSSPPVGDSPQLILYDPLPAILSSPLAVVSKGLRRRMHTVAESPAKDHLSCRRDAIDSAADTNGNPSEEGPSSGSCDSSEIPKAPKISTTSRRARSSLASPTDSELEELEEVEVLLNLSPLSPKTPSSRRRKASQIDDGGAEVDGEHKSHKRHRSSCQ